jgi:iron complex outermembrane receptor protein
MAVALALAAADTASAEPSLTRIRVSAGPLSHTLQEISRETGSELLFDRRLVAGFKVGGINATTTPMAALQTVLAGTPLVVRRAASGALIIEQTAAPPLARQDVAVSEILVLGRRTQNVDIRRQETDIQPYRVTTGDQITGAHVDTLGDYFQTHVTTNANVEFPGAGAAGGNSQIDIRGLGSHQTLVLIDGRRMPGFPSLNNGVGFDQPDLNALPLFAIDRVETLTGTAGGIYGYGALGGVVNVVLAHDRPGAELHVTTGLSSRGDAARGSFEARVEFSPDHGATDVTLDAGLTRSEPLTVGQRDYRENDLRETYQLAPSYVLNAALPHGNSIAIFNAFGIGPLTLKPQYGGASLGSPFTFLPNSLNGTSGETAALLSHAGKLDFSLSSGAAASYLQSNSELGSLLMNVRHAFSGGVEVYFDGIMLWNHSRYVNRNTSGTLFLDPTTPYDPFQQYVSLSFPTQTLSDTETDYDSSRFTIGVVAPIAFDWRATAEATWGGARLRESGTVTREDVPIFFGDDFNIFASIDAFNGWTNFEKALSAYQESFGYNGHIDTVDNEQSLRLAGPLFRTPAGPATLTLLAERRSEGLPSYGPNNQRLVVSQSITTTSVSAEFRSRVFDDKAPLPIFRDLQVQLAVRYDNQSVDFTADPTPSGPTRLNTTFAGTTFTAGAQASPLSWLMLRGSFATGATPPPVQYLVPEQFATVVEDPKRGDEFAFVPIDYGGGSLELKSVLASTTSVGFVLTPFGPRGARFSLDYSNISETHAYSFLDDTIVIAHEDYWPQRVQREPLTAADQALGYMAGPILAIDSRPTNGDSIDVQTLDAQFDWIVGLPVGALHLYGSATYTFHDMQKRLFQSTLNYYDAFDGPLVWRANAGADWSLGPWLLGVDVQYFGSYNANLSEYSDPTITELFQGSQTIPAQTYVDLRISRRSHLKNTDLRIDFGVDDVLDAAPPRVSSFLVGGPGYSPYGDPRQRRFELSVSALF